MPLALPAPPSPELPLWLTLEPVDESEPTSEPSETVRRDPSFYSDHIVFQVCVSPKHIKSLPLLTQRTPKVGMRLFKVPRRKFEEGSEVFRNMFAMPLGDGVVEGQTDEHPLVLESISMEEFRSLLRVTFNP